MHLHALCPDKLSLLDICQMEKPLEFMPQAIESKLIWHMADSDGHALVT